MNIYEKMSAITNEIAAVAKNLSVNTGQSSYKAVGEADVLAAVKPAEAKYKVYSYPVSRDVVETGELVTTTRNGERRQQFMRLMTVYRFVNMENPEEYIDITTYGDGVDSQDKAPGKAMTYADKYALLKAYKIITGDDPDQNGSEELKKRETRGGTPMISDKQKNFIKNLLQNNDKNRQIFRDATAQKSIDELTMAEATALIGAMKNGS